MIWQSSSPESRLDYLTKLKLYQLKAEVHKHNLKPEGDRRFKRTYINALLDFNRHYKSFSLPIYISKWQWLLLSKSDKQREYFLHSLSNQLILEGVQHLLLSSSKLVIRRIIQSVLKFKDYLLEDLLDIVVNSKSSIFSLKDLRNITVKVMSSFSKDERSTKSITAYQLLDVNKKVSKLELKRRYRELCKIHHPDSSRDNSYEYFNMISHAYKEVLNNIINKESKHSTHSTQ